MDWINWQGELRDLLLIALAGFLGGLVGLERELARKPAGLRTHIFVAAAAALFMLVSQNIIDNFQQQEGASVIGADPIRVLQAIVVGVSFLGAGTIIYEGKEGKVEGLTTAASILLTTGIGVAVATWQLVLATGISLLAVVVLYLVGVIERIVFEPAASKETRKAAESEAVASGQGSR